MSFNGCPELTSSVRAIGGHAFVVDSEVLESRPGTATRKYVGFVSHENEEKEETEPNMARGKGC